MTGCRRGCCWTPHCCAKSHACPCHATDRPRNEPQGSDAQVYRDPTAEQAIRNIMRNQGRKTR